MRTGGYDVLVEANERMLNRALAAAYHASFFSRFKGSVVPRSQLPFTGLARVDYDIRLREPPMIDLVPQDRVRLRASFAVVLTLAGKVRVPVNVTANILAKVLLDQESRQVSVELVEMGVEELRVGGRHAPPRWVLPLVNQVLSAEIRSNLLGEVTRAMGVSTFSLPSSMLSSDIVKLDRDIPVSLFPGFPGVTLEVPEFEVPLASMIPHEMVGQPDGAPGPTVTAGHFGIINNSCLAAALSFQNETPGDPRGIKDFIGDGDMAIGLSEESIRRILDDVWPSVPRTIRGGGRVDVDDARELLDSLRGLLDFPSHLRALGLERRTTKVARAWVDYDALVTPDKPNVRLIDGGTIEIFDTMVDVRVKATARTRLLTTTSRGMNPFFPAWMGSREKARKPEVKERDTVLYEFDQYLHVDLRRAVAELAVDGDRLMVKAVDVDFDMRQISLPMALPKFVLDTITNMIERRIKGGFPPVDLTAILNDRVLSRAPIPMNLKAKRVTGEGSELIIVGDVVFKDIPETVSTLPSFIADSRGCRVHRADCPSLVGVRERDKVGYTSLYAALAHGYLGADDCLPAYKEGLDADSAVDLSVINLDLSGIIARGEGLSRKLAEAAARCVPAEGRPEPASTGEPRDGAIDEVQCEDDEDGPAGPVKIPIPISGPECPGPVDGEADDEEPPEIAGKVDRGEERDDP